jgi:hypothetical protein
MDAGSQDWELNILLHDLTQQAASQNGVERRLSGTKLTGHKKYCKFLIGLKHAKDFLQGPSAKRSREILKIIRHRLWWVRGLLTGHCHLKARLSNWD